MDFTSDFDPQLDLALERIVPVPVESIWAAWTTPELLLPWFTPSPWTTVSCEIDLRPGGHFKSVMRSPEGQEFPNVGCYLEIVPMARLVWTNLLLPGYRPRALRDDGSCDGFGFVACLDFDRADGGTRYRARLMHSNEKDCQTHAAMGFQEGWGKALNQLVEMIQRDKV